jgi:hypothetical protein
MPKILIDNNCKLQAGILGDLMIHKNHRVFGPTLIILKTAIKHAFDNGFDIIYTLPNNDSIKIIERVGFEETKKMSTFVKIIDVPFYFRKYCWKPFSENIGFLAKKCIQIFSKETYVSYRGLINERNEFDSYFDDFFEKYQSTHLSLISEKKAAYLQWRYFENPLTKYRVLVHTEKFDMQIHGYLIFSIKNRMVSIYDILSVKKDTYKYLLKKVIQIANDEDCNAIYFTVPKKSRWPNLLRLYWYVDIKNDWSMYSICKKNISIDTWDFFQGDRNL